MRFAAPLALVVVLLLPSLRADVRVVGSDLLGKNFTSALNAYSKRNDLGIVLDLNGSEVGLEQLRAGTADMGIIILAPDEKKPDDGFTVIPAAYETAVVVVPASLPLSQITFDQLNSIYADAGASTIKTWGDMGVTGVWAGISVLPAITGPGSGLCYDLFRHTALAAPTLRPTVSVDDSIASTLQDISGASGGIAIVPGLPAGYPGLKTLAVARSASDVAFGPGSENIQTGYPIRLPVYFVFKKSAAQKLQVLLGYLLSDDAVPLWKGANLVPLPSQARSQAVFNLESL